MTTMISKMEEESFKEERMLVPREASTKLKMRERKEASRLNPKLPGLKTIKQFAEMETTALNLQKDPKLASLILKILALQSSRAAIAISPSLLRRLDTSRSQSLLLET
jgi:hypothetical protein